jgi:hypothetical protein
MERGFAHVIWYRPFSFAKAIPHFLFDALPASSRSLEKIPSNSASLGVSDACDLTLPVQHNRKNWKRGGGSLRKDMPPHLQDLPLRLARFNIV